MEIIGKYRSDVGGGSRSAPDDRTQFWAHPGRDNALHNTLHGKRYTINFMLESSFL